MKRFIAAVCLILLASQAHAQFNGGGFNNGSIGGSLSIPNYTSNGGLPHWKACFASFKLGTSASCNTPASGPVIMVIGDSQSTGHGSFFAGTANDARSGSWANELAYILSLPGNGFTTSINTVGGTNSITPTSTYDTRLTVNGWAAFPGLFVTGGALWANNDTTKFVFNPTDYQSYPAAVAVQSNAIDIYWAGNVGDANTVVTATQNSGTSGVATTTSTTLTFKSAPSVNPTTGASAFIYGPGIAAGTTVSAYNSGTLTMTLSAAASVPVNSTLSFNPSTICTITGGTPSFQFNKTTCTTPLGPNVYTLTCSSATVHLCSFASLNAYNSSVQSITIFQAASDGSTAANWAQNNSFPTDPTTSMSVYLPDLIVFGEIGNSIAAQTAINTYTASLTTIVTASKTAVSGVSGKSTDVILNTGLPFAADGTPLTSAQYQAAVAASASANNVPIWDSMAAFGGTTSGWFKSGPFAANGCCGSQDISHWSIGASVREADIYSQILQQ